MVVEEVHRKHKLKGRFRIGKARLCPGRGYKNKIK